MPKLAPLLKSCLCYHLYAGCKISYLSRSKFIFTCRIMLAVTQKSKEITNIKEPTQNIKKPFNKKKWREQKYSGKAKVQTWENNRRKQAQKQFFKECKNMGVNFKLKEGDPKLNKTNSLSPFKKFEKEYKEIQKVKEERKKEQERIQKERDKAIKAYKEKKALRFKKLSQKTNKGQPLMRARIELLLEKIQKEYGKCDNPVN